MFRLPGGFLLPPGKGAGRSLRQPSIQPQRCGNAAEAPSRRCGNAAMTPVSETRERLRNDIGLIGAGTPIRTTGHGLRFRRIGKRAHCAWRINDFQDWERLKVLSLMGRGAQCYSPPSPDLEAEGKEGRPRSLKRARPTSLLALLQSPASFHVPTRRLRTSRVRESNLRGTCSSSLGSPRPSSESLSKDDTARGLARRSTKWRLSPTYHLAHQAICVVAPG